MKKLFTLAAAVLVSFSLFADTETSANSGTSNQAVVGNSYTIPGAYVAGAGGKQVTPMPNKGIKVRLNAANNGGKNDTIIVNVNKGHKITALTFTGVTNTDDKTATFGAISVDGTEWKGTYDPTLPAKNASAAAKIEMTGLEAIESIIFAFSAKEATQANICLEVTYEVTATTYKATYKANYGEIADVVDEKALIVAGNPFKFPENQYFIGWNTAADGTGEKAEIGDELNADVTLYAQWKAFKAGAALDIAAEGAEPAKGGAVALEEGGNLGKLYFAGAVNNDYTASFLYKPEGLQMSKGGADSLRLELNGELKAGAVIQIKLVAVNDGTPSLNIVSNGKTVVMASNVSVKKEDKDTVSVYYTVVAEDGFAGAKKFIIQRGASSVILNAVAIEGMEASAPESEKSKDASIKSLEINKTEVKENNGVFAYEVAADAELAKVKVEFVLADKATADKTSGFEIDVPEAGAAAKEETINVTAEDGVTKKAYKVSITKAKKGGEGEGDGKGDGDQAVDNVNAESQVVKTFVNGQLVIIKNGVKYTITGAELR